MAGDTIITTLGATADLITGFPFKSSFFTEAPADIRLLRGDNVAQGFIKWSGVKRWAKSKYMEDYLLRPGDVVVAMDRPWIEAGLKHATLTEADCPSLLVQRVACLRARAGLDQRFLGYVIRSQAFTDYVLGVQTGTAVPHISGSQIRAFPFKMPPLRVQEAASALLGALDDKIELNRRMALTSEETARALFRSWFVDFDPVRAKAQGRPSGLPHEINDLFPSHFDAAGLPAGWKRDPLLEHALLISGGTPKTEMIEYWDGSVPWASAKDVSQCRGLFLTETERSITELGLEKSSTRVVPALSTVVVARGATTGRACMLAHDMAMNQTCYALSSSRGVPFWLWFSFHENIASLIQAAHGSVFDTITTSTLKASFITTAPHDVVLAFERLIEPLLLSVLVRSNGAAHAASVRDTLLPKLMSGELRVREAEQAMAVA